MDEDKAVDVARDGDRVAWAGPKQPGQAASVSAPTADTGCRIRLESPVMSSSAPTAAQR